MRLWHKDLIPYLPRQQLRGQWRECCLIAKNIAEKGTPGHILVNRIMKYPPEHFNRYAGLVRDEMIRRGYKCDFDRFMQYRTISQNQIDDDELFANWHNDDYLTQCFYNLQEKFCCGRISLEEWIKIDGFYTKFYLKMMHKRYFELFDFNGEQS